MRENSEKGAFGVMFCVLKTEFESKQISWEIEASTSHVHDLCWLNSQEITHKEIFNTISSLKSRYLISYFIWCLFGHSEKSKRHRGDGWEEKFQIKPSWNMRREKQINS